MIYVVTTMFIFLVEMICWGLRTSSLGQNRLVRWIDRHAPPDPVLLLLNHFGRTLNRANTNRFTAAGRTRNNKMIQWWKDSRWTDLVDVVLRGLEVENSIWWVKSSTPIDDIKTVVVARSSPKSFHDIILILKEPR